MVRRSAFTLIELIFAIVIIAITVVSLPMMTQATAKAVDSNLVQEAIFAAAGELNEAVTAHWDENSLEPGFPDMLARVIDELGTCENNASLANFRQMPGHINQPLHRRCLDSNAIFANHGAGGVVNDLNDMAHGAQNIFIDTTTDASGYKKNYNSAVTVSPDANFGLTAGNPNIKLLQSTITDTSGTTIVSLRAYSSNVGEIDYYKREY